MLVMFRYTNETEVYMSINKWNWCPWLTCTCHKTSTRFDVFKIISARLMSKQSLISAIGWKTFVAFILSMTCYFATLPMIYHCLLIITICSDVSEHANVNALFYMISVIMPFLILFTTLSFLFNFLCFIFMFTVNLHNIKRMQRGEGCLCEN